MPSEALERNPDAAPAVAGLPRADICVLKNAGSGRQGGRDEVAELEAALGAYPGRFELRLLRGGDRIEEAAAQAVADGFTTVVAAGGDGTVCAVAGAAAGGDVRLGVLPFGTFNYFARALGVTDDIEAAVRAIAEGAPRSVHLGRVNGRPFLNNASLGLYPTILRERERIYRRWGRSRIAAHWSMLRTIVNFRRPLALKVTVDGEVRRARTPLVFVASNPRQLEELGIDGTEGMREGRFALFIAPDCSGLELLGYIFRLATRRMNPGRDFELMHGREIVVETARRRMPVARDGERELMEGPFRFELQLGALSVMAPPAEEEDRGERCGG